MSQFLILLCIFLPILLLAWFHKRLRDAVDERHPGVLHGIDSMTRSLPRTQRQLERHSRYRTLHDPEIDRHIRNLDRAQFLVQCVWLAGAALIIVLVVVSAPHR